MYMRPQVQSLAKTKENILFTYFFIVFKLKFYDYYAKYNHSLFLGGVLRFELRASCLLGRHLV
jgi:hypothetical protein